MAHGHWRKNPSAEERPVILALECPKFNESSSSRRPVQPRARVPRNPRTSFSTLLSPFIVTIHTGEDIGNKIRGFFEERIQSNSGGFSIEGHIYGITGDISNPKIDVHGSVKLFEGNYSMATLSGRYIISGNGVQQDYLRVGFQPDDALVCATVVGPLIAGSGVQVTLKIEKMPAPPLFRHHSASLRAFA